MFYKSEDTMLYRNKTVAMQRLQDLARHYDRWTGGVVAVAKFEALSEKFAELYETAILASSKNRRKKKGQAVATFLAYADGDSVHWWLLATSGRGRITQREILMTVAERRITAPGGYELVHDGVSWSWKYTTHQYQKLRDSLHYAIASKRDVQLQSLIVSIYATVGFRLARVQVGDLIAFYRRDWARLRGLDDKPALPKTLYYARRLPNRAPNADLGANVGEGAAITDAPVFPGKKQSLICSANQ
jgi:hypothetical protein